MKSTHSQPDARPEHEAAPARPRGSAGLLQRKAAGGASGEAPPVVAEALDSPGGALEPSTRELLEARFGHDFGRVRVHADARAAESAEAVEARAYTVGDHVVFGPGQYAPHTQAGRALLAHELTHTLQQRDAGPALQTRLEISRPGDPSEAEADRVASLAAGPARAASVPPVKVSAAPHVALMRDAKAEKKLGLGSHEPAVAVAEELKTGFDTNMKVVKNSAEDKEKMQRLGDGKKYYKKAYPELPGPEMVPRVQYFLKIDLVYPRIDSYLTANATKRINTDEAKKVADPKERQGLVYNPSESWDKIVADLTRAVAAWQKGRNEKAAEGGDKLPIDGGLDEKTVAAMRADGLVENDEQVWAARDEQEWSAVREEEKQFWRKPGEGGDAVRDKIVGLAMSQIGKVSQQNRGDHRKFGWQRVVRYYEVAYGAADERRKQEWLRENFVFESFDTPSPEAEQRIWGAGMEGLGASGHMPSAPLGRPDAHGPAPGAVGRYSDAALKEASEDNPYTTAEAVRQQTPKGAKGYEALKKEQSASFLNNFGENVHPALRPRSPAGKHEAHKRVQRPDVFAFKDAGPWSWCAIFTMWAVKSVTGRGLWVEAPVGLKSTTVGKPSDLKGARRGDILSIHSSNSHHVLLAKDPSPDPTADELLEAVEGNIEVQGIRHSKRWRVKNVAKFYSAVD